MIEVLVEPIDQTDEHVRADWLKLETGGNSSFFTSWDWVGTLFETLPAKSNLYLLRFKEDGEIVGLAYLGKEKARRHLLVWSKRLHLNSPGEPELNCMATEDNALITRPGLENACWDALIAWFTRSQSLVDELVLPGLRDPLHAAFDRGRFGCYNIELRSWHVDLKQLEQTGGQLVDLLSRNARYQLRRSIRDYGGGTSLTLAAARSTEQALSWFEEMKKLHIDSWGRRGKKHAFSCKFFETFHRSLIQRTFPLGRIQMLCVYGGDSPIGFLYNFRDGSRTYAYQSGFLDKDRRLRPGAVAHALAIEYNFQLGVDIYDFMAGSNRLKSSFATSSRSMHWITMQLPRRRFRLENWARNVKHSIWASAKP